VQSRPNSQNGIVANRGAGQDNADAAANVKRQRAVASGERPLYSIYSAPRHCCLGNTIHQSGIFAASLIVLVLNPTAAIQTCLALCDGWLSSAHGTN
jgi:hypothetical protein